MFKTQESTFANLSPFVFNLSQCTIPVMVRHAYKASHEMPNIIRHDGGPNVSLCMHGTQAKNTM